jgi:hypothetical protein
MKLFILFSSIIYPNMNTYPKRLTILLPALILIISCSKKPQTTTPITPTTSIVTLRDYLQPSYILSNYQNWIDPNTLFESTGNLTPKNLDPTDITSSSQLDIDMDGDEDIFSFKNYDINIPGNVPPPVLYLNNGKAFIKSSWAGPSTMRGNKTLVGDFNGDKKPDIFSVEAYDPPNTCNCMPDMTTNKLLLNMGSNLTNVKEISGLSGFWVSGCSGDIDKDGDLDVLVFNFHLMHNGVKNKLLLNDGSGNFTTTEISGISGISLVDASELIDINKDGYLDLVLNNRNQAGNANQLRIFWGDGKTFNLSNVTNISIPNIGVYDIDAYDVNGDGTLEVILFSIDPNGWAVDFYGSTDKGGSFANQSSKYISTNTNITAQNGFIHVKHIFISDIDNNGKVDIVSSNRSVNVRWEQDAGGVFRRKY